MERRKYWLNFLAVAGLVLLYCVLQNLSTIWAFIQSILSAFSPIVMGFIFAFILNIPMCGLERLWEKVELGIKRFIRKRKEKKNAPLAESEKGKKKRKSAVLGVKMSKVSRVLCRPVCLLLSVVLILALISAIVAIVLPEIVNAVMMIIDGAQVWFEKVKVWCIEYAEEYPMIYETITEMKIDWDSTAKSILGVIGSGTIDVVGTTFSSIISTLGGIVDIIIALIFAIYVLLSKELLKKQLDKFYRAFLPGKIRLFILHITSTSQKIFTAFITGQCIEAVILGSLCTIGMLIFGFPYAGMIGVLVGVTALIPVVGAFIGAGVGAFLILIIDPFQALMFLVFILILQQIEGNIIYPKVVGSSVGLPAMWVLAAVTVGGSLGGIGGMLFAVPIASILYTLMGEFTKRQLRKKRRHKKKVTEYDVVEEVSENDEEEYGEGSE